MNILFIHQNFSGQFKFLAPALVQQGHNVVAMTMQKVNTTEWQGVKLVPYSASRGTTPNVHPWVSDFETKTIRGEACFRAALNMKAEGFVPDVIVAHHGWGESLFLKDVWPLSRLGIYCEFFYHAQDADVSFDPEFPVKDAGEVCRLRLKNLNNLLHFEVADAGISPTHWQASTFPEPFRSKITVVHDGIDTETVAPNPNVSLTLNGNITLTKANEVITFVNEAARKRGAKDFDLKAVIFPVDLPNLDKTVRAEMARVLAPLAEVVHAYDCDILLLSGRPSRLPGIRSLVMELLPLPPERVISLHEYRVGAWYPFRDARLRVEDPKTTVAVGAMIAALAQSQLPDFSFRSDLLRSKSIAKFIGKLDGGGRLQKEDLVYRDVDLDNRDYELPEIGFEFRGPMWLGARQLDLARWPAARLYALEFAKPEYAERHARETPFNIALARVKPKDKDSGDVERFRLRQITNRDGRAVALDRLTLRLQTLPRREGYWLDTGMLKTG